MAESTKSTWLLLTTTIDLLDLAESPGCSLEERHKAIVRAEKTLVQIGQRFTGYRQGLESLIRYGKGEGREGDMQRRHEYLEAMREFRKYRKQRE